MTYFTYLDEFGHIGPYVSRQDPKYKESPVFGLAGFTLPSERVRDFGTWFFQRKCELLSWEIGNSEEHPARWEKKGSSLYTVRNIEQYPEVRRVTNRLFNKIDALGGFVFYVGVRKTKPPEAHEPSELYKAILGEAIKRIDQFCEYDCDILLSRCSRGKATAIKHCKQQIGLPHWWGALGPTGLTGPPTPKTMYSVSTSSTASTG